MLKVIASRDRNGLERLFARRARRLGRAEETVKPILDAVARRGDRALIEYARRFDGLEDGAVAVKKREMERALSGLSRDFSKALTDAAKQIRRFAQLQMPKAWRRIVRKGVEAGQIIRPLQSVAAYIPGGRYPLPSTLMMTVIPAQVARVPVISAASPRPSAETLGAAGLLGVERFFRVGGAQAIAAFAFGTATVPKADRIVGPGNIYVAAAKKLLAGQVGIDFIAGPTEIVLIAPDGDPRLLAADMLAQAEHDVDASALLLTSSKRLANRVAQQVAEQIEELPTRAVACKSIANNSAIIVTRSLQESVEIANRLAPEHLTIPDDALLPDIRNAGSIFVGPWSAEAAGDYAAGPNHVLPTGGAARIRGGLSVLDFVKVISVQQLDEDGLRALAPAILTLARAEGLEAHARSIEVRLNG